METTGYILDYIHIYKYMHVLLKKQAMNLKEGREEYMGGFAGRKGKGEIL